MYKITRIICLSVLIQTEFRVDQKEQKRSLMNFHRRFGHLHSHNINSMSEDPASGIVLADEVHSNWFTRVKGKQTKNK